MKTGHRAMHFEQHARRIVFKRELNALRQIKALGFENVAEERQCFDNEAMLFR